MLNLRIKLCFLLLITSLNAQNGEIDEFVRTLQENSEKFKFVKVNKRQKAVDFDVNLGDSAVTLPGEGRVDGFRFKVPQGVADLDFVWYFNAPENWGNWYLCPVEGEFETSFTSFLNAVKVYKKFDEAGKADRFRVLQSLSSGYFKEGKEYIMWFRNSEASGVGKVSGRLKFHKAKEKWEHKEIVKALSLEAASLEDQIKELKSVGGKILMDKEFFHLNYANNRVDNVFYSIRRTQRLRGGLFITTEFKVPSCETSPSIAEIRKRYGEPDFILTDTEKKSVRRHTGGHVEEDENTITYYYDYFGFVVEKDDPKEIVQSVDTGANNFANLNSKKLEPSYGHLSMKNLTVFTNGGKEVGRMYYFNEGEKEPGCGQAILMMGK